MRQLDALARVAKHRFTLHRDRAGEVAIRRDGAEFNAGFTGKVAETLSVIRRKIHGSGVRALGVEFHTLPALLFCQPD